MNNVLRSAAMAQRQHVVSSLHFDAILLFSIHWNCIEKSWIVKASEHIQGQNS